MAKPIMDSRIGQDVKSDSGKGLAPVLLYHHEFQTLQSKTHGRHCHLVMTEVFKFKSPRFRGYPDGDRFSFRGFRVINPWFLASSGASSCVSPTVTGPLPGVLLIRVTGLSILPFPENVSPLSPLLSRIVEP